MASVIDFAALVVVLQPWCCSAPLRSAQSV
jgi:hypothetical protein